MKASQIGKVRQGTSGGNGEAKGEALRKRRAPGDDGGQGADEEEDMDVGEGREPLAIIKVHISPMAKKQVVKKDGGRLQAGAAPPPTVERRVQRDLTRFQQRRAGR